MLNGEDTIEGDGLIVGLVVGLTVGLALGVGVVEEARQEVEVMMDLRVL
mgnify:CR=1 FL=1